MLPPRICSVFAGVFMVFCVTNNDVALALTPPPQAASAGYAHLTFDEEFNRPPDIGYGSPGHKWNGEWDGYYPSDPSHFPWANGVLTIIADANQGMSLTTQYQYAAGPNDLSSGSTYFTYGYFEAHLKCTDWSAFYLFDAQRRWVYGNAVTSNPATWTSEIDVIETDPGVPHTAVCTVHKNTGGDGGIPDEQNWPNSATIAGSTINQWHTYGVLWTPTQVTWYVDNQQVCTAPTYLSTRRPMALVLTAHPGGVGGSPSTVNPPTTAVKWVRVWH
ncbi:MAG: glycoside hydrolase family 16 protein [Verrucomicrobia bacterium]|nr:glycoside hydrolase family 16 protein [Verrucomicrobiota bacterium]